MNFKRNILVAVVGLGLALLSTPANAQVLECEFPENQHVFDHGPFFVQPLVGKEYVPMMPSDEWKVIDVGSIYTEKQADKVGDSVARELQRDHLVGSNIATTASNMKVLYRWVAQEFLPSSKFLETGSTMQDLVAMANSDTSGLGPFAGFRDRWGADIMMLSVSSGGGFGGGAYVVVGNSSTKTAAHELGHCLGMNHDKGSSPACNADDQLCLRSHGYLGYTSSGERFADVMATGPEDSESHLWYSNLLNTYKGAPVGEAGVAEAAVVGEIIAADVQNAKPSKASSVCTPDANTLCLRQGRFLVKAYVRRPTMEGHALMVPVASNAGEFTFSNLLPVQVKLTCKAQKLVVTMLGSVPKAVMTSILVLDTKNGQHLSVVKKAKVAFKPGTTTTELSCK